MKKDKTSHADKTQGAAFLKNTLRLLKMGTRDLPMASLLTLKSSFATVASNPKILQSEYLFVFLGEFLVHSFRQAGPVFIKIGQTLAAREDLIPKPLCQKLTELYDRQPPIPFRHVEKIIAETYEQNPFRSINPEPLGVGSVGQVHRAQLNDGTEVAVKVIKPGVEDAASSDLLLLKSLTGLLKVALPRSKMMHVTFMERSLADLSTSLQREFDLQRECMNLLNFKKRCRKNPMIYIPDSYPSLTKRNILVMEYVEGVSIGTISGDKGQLPEAKRQIAKVILKELLEQVFEDGNFHADPHAGNLLLLPDGRVAFLDLGLTGDMTSESKGKLVEAVKALIAQNPDRAMDALLGFAIVPENFDRSKFRNNIARIYREHAQASTQNQEAENTKKQGLEGLVQELFLQAHSSGLYLPESTTLFIKAMVTIEAVARGIDPQINIKGTAVSVIAQSAFKNLLSKFK